MHRDLRDAWMALWTSRVLVWISGMGAVWIWGLSVRAPGFDPTGLGSATWTAPAVRWDAVWFLDIAHSGYDDGPTANLGDSDVRHHEDGTVTVGGEEVDNPEDYKGDPIPGGPTDPNAADPEGLKNDDGEPESDVDDESESGSDDE